MIVIAMAVVPAILISHSLPPGPQDTTTSLSSVSGVIMAHSRTQDRTGWGGSMGVAVPMTGPEAATSNWTNLSTPPAPGRLQDYSMTYDVAAGYVLLFGGILPSGYASNATWIFSNGSWTNISSNLSVAPFPRYDMTMVYDSGTGYVLAVGGESIGSDCPSGTGISCNDTWEFGNGKWSELDPLCYDQGLVAPIVCDFEDLYLSPAADDVADGYVLVCVCNGGLAPGSDLIYRDDSWTWVGFNFTTNTSYPSADLGAIAYDAADGYVIGFGAPVKGAEYMSGQIAANYTYRWIDNDTWTNITANVSGAPPDMYSDGTLVYDSTGGFVLLYGGAEFTCLGWAGSSCSKGTNGALANTWMYHDLVWTNLSGGLSPRPRADPALADDLTDGGVLLFGGLTCPNTTCPSSGVWPSASNDTWFWGQHPPVSGLSIRLSRTTVDVGVPVAGSAIYNSGTAPIAFTWSWGDGGFATGQNASHTYRGAGTFLIVLWANDSAGHHEISNTLIGVASYPGSSPLATPNPGEAGQEISFQPKLANGTPPFAYDWNFGDGGTSSASSPTHVYSRSGLYIVSLLINDSGGGFVHSVFNVSVASALQVAIFALPNPTSLGEPVNFSATVSGGLPPYSYAWDFGDGATGGNLSAITHIYTTNGPFLASVQVSDAAGQSRSTSTNITIELSGSIDANSTFGAAPLTVGFRSLVSGGVPSYQYSWKLGNGSTSFSPDPSHTYELPGTYQVSLQVKDAVGDVFSSEWWVTVFPGGGGLKLETLTSPTNPTPGSTVLVIDEPSGGAGSYELNWTQIPSNCIQTGVITLACVAVETGTYLGSARLSDSFGHAVVSNWSFTVSNPTNSRGSPLGLASTQLVYLALGLVFVASASLSAGYLIRDRRVRSLDHRPLIGGPYHEYRLSADAGDASAPSESAEELGDLL
jgi:PKD repeat protein